MNNGHNKKRKKNNNVDVCLKIYSNINENSFEKIFRICLGTKICEYLNYDEKSLNVVILNLILCCKTTKYILYDKGIMFNFIQLDAKFLKKCNKYQKIIYKKYVRDIFVDDHHLDIDYLSTMVPKLSKLTLKKYNYEIIKGDFPSSLTYLDLGLSNDKNYNLLNSKNIFPYSLKYLNLGVYFDHLIIPKILPDNLTHLVFGKCYNKPILIDALPTNLLDLEFGSSFNQKIIFGSFPNNLTKLTFGDDFNKPLSIESLPCNLKQITFGKYFDQYISKGVLPDCLEILTFGHYFNKSIDDTLPLNLIELTFGFWFNQSINFILLQKLKKLKFGFMFNQSLDNLMTKTNTIYIELPCVLKQKIPIDMLNQAGARKPSYIKINKCFINNCMICNPDYKYSFQHALDCLPDDNIEREKIYCFVIIAFFLLFALCQ